MHICSASIHYELASLVVASVKREENVNNKENLHYFSKTANTPNASYEKAIR